MPNRGIISSKQKVLSYFIFMAKENICVEFNVICRVKDGPDYYVKVTAISSVIGFQV